MENKEKELLLNRGLLLGLFFSVFPILDLMFGAEMSLSKYYSLFYGVWFLVYSVFIVYIGKEFKAFSPIFDFRNSFRVLFIVSALAFSILTVTRISLWNVFYPVKYIELNESRETKFITKFSDLIESTLDKAYADGMIFQTEKQLKEFGEKLSDDKKAPIEEALVELKAAHESKDLEAIDAAMEIINTAWTAASEEMYKASQEEGAAAEPATDDVTDVEFEEVKEEEFGEKLSDETKSEIEALNDEYDESLAQLVKSKNSFFEKWEFIKENGISKSLFIGNLIYNLFFIAIYNAILALFLRRKNEIA